MSLGENSLSYSVLFFFGAVLGSFLNVCIYRLPRGQSLLFPPSSCPVCKARIKIVDLIPIVSFLLLRGKCRACGAKIANRYLWVELLAGGVFVVGFIRFGLGFEFLRFCTLALLLIVISFIDFEHKLILNKVTYFGMAVGLLLSPLGSDFFNACVGLVLGGGLLFAVAVVGKKVLGRDCLGGGDIKLAAMIGAFIGWKHFLLILFLGSAVGTVAGAVLILFGKMKREARLPFAPFLAVGVGLVLLLGEVLSHLPALQLFYQ
ncbi:MAG: prepilin peptidase [bacterium]